MTSAPQNLLDVRTLLLSTLPINALSIGIVGNSAHVGGYHCGSDRVVPGDYSVVESPRDSAGLSLSASGLDVGAFALGDHNLRTFSIWLVAECVAGAADTLDIREVIYSPDGKVVKRWDRLGKRSSGDSSHTYHTHISFFRDATKDGRDLRSVFRRYIAYVLGQSAPTPTPAPAPKPTPPPYVPTLHKAWPSYMRVGHYFGLITGPNASHGGYYASERPDIKLIQQRLIILGYVPGVTNPSSGWADGKYEQATKDAVSRWQRARYAGTTSRYGEVWSDDWRHLFTY